MELVTFVSTDKTSGTLLCKLSMHSPGNILGNTEAVIVTHLIIHLQKEKKKSLEVQTGTALYFALNFHTLKPVSIKSHNADDIL